MKQLFLFICIFVTIISFGQGSSDNPKQIVFNFKEKIFDPDYVNSLKDLKRGQFYKIKVSNINLNLYYVNVAHKDSVISTTVKIPSFESFGLEAISSLIGSITPSTTASTNIIENNLNLISENLQKEKVELETLNEESSLVFNTLSPSLANYVQNEYLAGFTDSNVKFKKFSKSSQTKINNFYELQEVIEEKMEIIKRLEQELLHKKEIYAKIYEGETNLKSQLLAIHKDEILPLDEILLEMNTHKLHYFLPDDTSIKCLESKKALCDFLTDIRKITDKLKQKREDLQKLKIVFDVFLKDKPERLNLMKKDSTLKVLHSNFENNISKGIAIIDKALEQINAEKMSAFMNSIIHLENNHLDEWTSLPIQFKGDIGEFQLSFTPKSADFGLPSYKQEFAFGLPKTYTGVSAGFYIGFGSNNERYSILESKNNTGTSDFEIIKENDQKVEIGFTTLLHYGKKYDKYQNVGYHFSVGPALSLSSVIKPRLCLGGGFSFGKYKNMLTVDFLLLTGYFDVKSNIYNVGQKYSTKPEQVTVSNLDAMIGLSIGYIYKF